MLLVTSGGFWKLLEAFEGFRMLLDTSGDFWVLLKVSGGFWGSLRSGKPGCSICTHFPPVRCLINKLAGLDCPANLFTKHLTGANATRVSSATLLKNAKITILAVFF